MTVVTIPKLPKVAQAAKAAGVPEHAIRRAIRTGEPKARPIGRCLRVGEAETHPRHAKSASQAASAAA